MDAMFNGFGASRSRPTRARGLKQLLSQDPLAIRLVAPHAGAWIETGHHLITLRLPRVAPHAGAWIETWL